MVKSILVQETMKVEAVPAPYYRVYKSLQPISGLAAEFLSAEKIRLAEISAGKTL